MAFVTGRQTHATLAGNAAGVMLGVIKGVPVTGASSQYQQKISISQNPNSDCNGHKDIRRKDDSAFTTIRDRKARISHDSSVYALRRSWLRNGFLEESQLQYMDSVRSLPGPLPLSTQGVTSHEKKDDDKEEEEEVST